MRIKECAERFVDTALQTYGTSGLSHSGGAKIDFRISSVHYFIETPTVTPKSLFLVFNPKQAAVIDVPKVFGPVRFESIHEYWKHSFIRPFSFNCIHQDYKSFNAFINRVSEFDTRTIACKGEWYVVSPWILLDKNFNVLYYITESRTTSGNAVKQDVYISNEMFASKKTVETNFVKYIIPTFIESGVRIHIGIPQSLAFKPIPPEIALQADIDINRSFNAALKSAANKFVQRDSNAHWYVKLSGTPTLDPYNSF